MSNGCYQTESRIASKQASKQLVICICVFILQLTAKIYKKKPANCFFPTSMHFSSLNELEIGDDLSLPMQHCRCQNRKKENAFKWHTDFDCDRRVHGIDQM